MQAVLEPLEDYPKIIGFERTHTQVGDCVIAIKALYALKSLYPNSKLIIFTDFKGGGQLYSYLNLADSIIDVETQNNKEQNLSNALNANPVDVLLLLHRTSWKIKVARNSPAKCIITELHMHNLLDARFKTPRMMISYFVHGSEKVLRLVRRINSKYYDNAISSIDFTQVQFHIPQENEAIIDNFLTQTNAKNYCGIIGVNPFGSSAHFNFDTQDWIHLTQELATQFPNLLFVLLTYQNNPYKLKPFKANNITIFENDNQLITLVALTKRLNLLLSLNTGNIHIADVLRIPTLIINKTKERYNCIGGSYGGEFDAIYLPKNWRKNYQHYYQTYTQRAIKKLQAL